MYYSKYNRRGRIALLEDASGFQTFKYGRMGEVIENNHTFVLPNENHQYSFRMQYSYDSWNRVQYISYPDGEEVLYRYNTGGMLDSVYGRKSAIMRDGTGDGVDVGRIGPTNPPPTYTYHYINHTTYNEFELKSGQWYGNGTQAHYSYDTLQRLSHLTAYKSARTPMQDITYTYDKVGNITQISNAAGVVNTLGNIYSYSYTYDSLYRLTSGYGSVGSGKPLANYTLNMQYEADGRIIQKNQSGRTRLNGTVQTFNDSRLYTYNTSQPHTVQSISGTNYYWDANGNMTNDGGAILTWDEENRLKRHSKSLKKTCFFYDAAGERYYKNSGATVFVMINGIGQQMTFYENPTLYASPYVVVTPDGYTKHYFVESERFASRIGDGTIMGLNNHVANAAALAAKQAKVNAAAPDSIVPNRFAILRQLQTHWSSHHTTYWQHSDHLGSASWVTDTNGMGYQHLQYMPWGEPLVDQRVSGATYRSRYTFSGKERDEETGYSYFGARHYHPTLSIWLSVDPMADKYPGVSPYLYCGNNPVRLVDEDGRFPIEIHRKLFQNAVRGQDCGLIYTMVQYGNSIYADVVHHGRSSTHMDNMKGTESIRDAYIKAMSSFNSNMEAGKYVSAGENLHTIADFYSHSNYVELYQRYMGDKIKTANDIRPFSEMMNDGDFMAFVEKEGGLKTGKYSIWRHYSKDSESHNMMNLDSPTSNNGKVKYGNSNRYTAAKNAAQKAINKIVEPYLNDCN